MDDKEVTNKYHLILEQIKRQIDSFDAKANILLAISGILSTVSVSLLPVTIKHSTQLSFLILLVIYTFLLIGSIFSFILVVIPRKRSKKIKKIQTNSNLYYWDLADAEPSEIRTEIQKVDLYHDDLTKQIKINSMVAKRKHKLLVFGIELLIVSLLLMFIAIMVHVFV
ncbi:hypothetical protein LD125_00105 [Mesoplasma sp. JKS002658]|uniref:Pycsar system effector family protein n=1 Tax=Mesoplasma whartonense TaxID=2878854 RepID=UPI002022A64A|nr:MULTISPECIES: Pycsar system effector family protein [unclassified Mesoplasma]MCL8211580.1 hypothetical protein [Mesoplasma sp. JKS002664]MCL8212040.1 hypothetical protein [Mesoplasma sp. JKS002662]MCL8213855.1 hypothetical protein [Mesoplasma sp. JKS002658]MCL8214821.1 hypothetical protein [Mesoplasma sp. JKS002663]MCL8215174.1 hypothetical protein [Mesoplasma sp. JKS002659]